LPASAGEITDSEITAPSIHRIISLVPIRHARKIAGKRVSRREHRSNTGGTDETAALPQSLG
jgi:hypothetical protein